ncbi:MAG: DUF488 family protein [Solirubrobacterales bacterium]
MTKHVYEAPEAEDGIRVLVDRVWPRGLPRREAQLDLWERELAPSADLQIWFGHQPDRFAKFRQDYIAELRGERRRLALLRARARSHVVTLLYAAHEREHNHAAILAEVLRGGLPKLEPRR